MSNMKPLIIFMAGSPAAGKSEMAYYLSGRLDLPIFSTDSVRHDVKVRTATVNINEVLKKFEIEREAGSQAMFKKGKSFIYDGSVDRRWAKVRTAAEDNGYSWLLISFDLSKERIAKNRRMFDRTESDKMYKHWLADHEQFMKDYGDSAQLHITDDNYEDRYELATQLVKNPLKR